jgi:hypothetical protein
MIDDLLVVQSKLKPGTYRISIKAQAITLPGQNTSTASVESHSLRMIVMTDRDKYPVFEKLSYELKVGGKTEFYVKTFQISSNANFPVKLPGFNASVNEGRIGYSLYNAAESVKGVKIDAITVSFFKLEFDKKKSSPKILLTYFRLSLLFRFYPMFRR